jgi:two-component system sensor histidine kinase UhpB
VVYRVAQEALTNVARHSGSERAELSLQRTESQIALTVRDRGNGFETERPAGSGIRGMRERAALIGATLEIRNGSPGTELLLVIPLEVNR